jgi:hypothetical protein
MDESHHYVNQPSGNLLCPICQEPFKNPYITRFSPINAKILDGIFVLAFHDLSLLFTLSDFAL